MAVSKRLRYEILRRDNHQCRYCGRSAPEVKLTVDHVVPVALGGSDEPANLAAACAECNGGKSSTPVDSPVVDDVAQDAIRWRNAMEAAAQQIATEEADADQYCRDFYRMWPRYLPSAWQSSLRSIRDAGLPKTMMLSAIEVAISKKGAEDYFRYFCGVCWTRIRQTQDAASQILDNNPDAEHSDVTEDPWEVDNGDAVVNLDVYEAWKKAAGYDVLAHVEFVSCNFGEITVRSDSTAWATQIRLLARELLSKINTELGLDGGVSDLTVLGPNSRMSARSRS